MNLPTTILASQKRALNPILLAALDFMGTVGTCFCIYNCKKFKA